MRNLVIKREKAYAACLAKMKVYIEDPMSDELIIENNRFRKLGTLKNGEEKSFIIGEDECRIVVIADKLSKNYCNEFCKIPAGDNDVHLSGKNTLSPATGNAFRFNGVNDLEVFQNRNKALKKGMKILPISIIFGVIFGFLLTSLILINGLKKPKVFEKEGMTITLNNQFQEVSDADLTACYDSKDVAVFALKEDFSQNEVLRTYSLEQYVNLAISVNNIDSKLQKIDDLTYFEYQSENTETKDIYHYCVFVYKTSDSFWTVQFATKEEDYNDKKQDIIDWNKDIEFSDVK